MENVWLLDVDLREERSWRLSAVEAVKLAVPRKVRKGPARLNEV